MRDENERRIGEFSLMSRLSVKALRFYHEEGLLAPARIDPDTGYRYYADRQLADAAFITLLKELGLSIAEIKEFLPLRGDPRAVRARLERKRDEYEEAARQLKRRSREIDALLVEAAAPEATKASGADARLAEAPALDYLGIRFRGRYDAVGSRFGELFRRAGRYAAGAPFCLYHEAEWRDGDADITAALPVSLPPAGLPPSLEPLRGRLEAATCYAVEHVGAYTAMGPAYAALFAAAARDGVELGAPVRETYLRGPGRLFPGDPAGYRTRIEIPVAVGSRGE